jgi:uncharacterized protein
MSVKRLDNGTIEVSAKLTDEGFLICPATVAKTGIQFYVQKDGTVRREYRPPEEVFHKDTLQSIAGSPVTFDKKSLNHPASGMINSKNGRDHIVGWTSSEVKQDGKFVKTEVKIFDQDAIEAASTRKVVQLSCGYRCDIEKTPGKSPEGEEYDVIQRNIRNNHVAMVYRGRAGPDVRMHLDADDNAVQPADEGDVKMAKMKINGVETEIPDIAAQLIEGERKIHEDAFTKFRADSEKQITDLKKEVDTHKARADSAEAAKVTAEKARTDAEDPKKIDALVVKRAELLSRVQGILGTEFKVDGKSEIELKKLMLAKLSPDLKLDGKSDTYIEVSFDYGLNEFTKKNPAALTRAFLFDSALPEGDNESENARNKFMKENVERSKKMGQVVEKQ